MKTTKKHPNYVMIVAGLLLSGYIGYLAAGAWQEGIKLEMFLDRFTEVCAYPLRDYFNQYTVKFVCFFMGAFLIFVIMYYTSQRNYMPGREYGTARLADPKKVSKVLGDRDGSRNRILSQNFRMSLDTRHTKLNNNVLIIGGSGDCGIIVTGRTNPVKSRVCEA